MKVIVVVDFEPPNPRTAPTFASIFLT